MKKLISLILILCMACLLVPATAEDDVTGDWYYAGMGDAVRFVFNADGTAKMITSIMGEQSENAGTWSLDGSAMTITFGEKSQTATYADGVITMEADGITATLVRDPNAGPVGAPAIVAAESEEAFLGTWNLSAIYSMSVLMPVDQMQGYAGTMTIADGKVHFELTAGEGTAPQSETEEYKFEDGKLIVSVDKTSDAAKMAEALGMPLADTATIELADDGSIYYSMVVMDLPMGYYFVKAQ